MLNKARAIDRLNELGASQTPFTFYCDFLGENWCIQPNNDGSPRFQIDFQSETSKKLIREGIGIQKNPIPFEKYREAFNEVQQQILFGNSFLTNLTFQTPIETALSLEQVYYYSQAKYKVLVPDHFVSFSPETFVQIIDDKIYSYPMKGTIDASCANAATVLLNDPKEMAEHVTIVDLIRNDLSQVASNVHVSKFRFIDTIKTNEKELLQVSSEVVGELPQEWQGHVGSILAQLLPAGSISGAPKPKTVEIIRKVEAYERGFYTGICGHFDGRNLDSCVMIRFIKKHNGNYYYCSGGGITAFSSAQKEYQEMLDKIYLPIQ